MMMGMVNAYNAQIQILKKPAILKPIKQQFQMIIYAHKRVKTIKMMGI